MDFVAAVARIPAAFRRRAEERRHRSLMETATTFRVATMPENTFGKLVGVVRPERQRLIEAPLSGRLCVYYELSIDAVADGLFVRELATEQEGMGFLLDDGDGAALVEPAHAFMSTGIDHVSESSLFPTVERELAIAKRLGVFGRPIRFADGLRYREAILEVDERIAVFGAGVREPDPHARGGASGGEGGYRGGMAATRLHLAGTSRHPLFISDDPRVL